MTFNLTFSYILFCVFLLFLWRFEKYRHFLGYSSIDFFRFPISLKARIFNRLPRILVYLIIVGIGFALLDPSLKSNKMYQTVNSRDIVLVVDLSWSMENKGKIDLAKEAMITFINKRKGDRISLFGFGDKVIGIYPFSINHNTLIKRISLLGDSEDYLGGTNIWLGLKGTLQFIKLHSKTKEPVLIIVSDGEDRSLWQNSRKKLIAHIIRERNIHFYWIYINKGITTFDSEVQNLKTFVTEENIGKYFEADDKQKFEEVMKEINNIEKTKYHIEVSKDKFPLYPLISLVVVFLMIGFIIIKGVEL